MRWIQRTKRGLLYRNRGAKKHPQKEGEEKLYQNTIFRKMEKEATK
jgi:hypothetical protein